MITVESRNLFGKWEVVKGKTFESVEAARDWCLEMADVTNIAYRLVMDGKPIDLIDLEADFWRIVQNIKETPRDPDDR